MAICRNRESTSTILGAHPLYAYIFVPLRNFSVENIDHSVEKGLCYHSH